MNHPLTIEGPRILLRDYRSDASDLNSVLAFVTDPEVATHSSWGPLKQQEAADWLQTVIAAQTSQPRIAFQLALIIKSTDDLIGNVSLHVRNAATKEAELGYTLRRDVWQKGYATEAARVIVDYGFRELGLRRIFATTSPLNISSQNVLKKVGFVKEAFLEKNVLQRGQWRDSFLYGLERRERMP